MHILTHTENIRLCSCKHTKAYLVDLVSLFLVVEVTGSHTESTNYNLSPGNWLVGHCIPTFFPRNKLQYQNKGVVKTNILKSYKVRIPAFATMIFFKKYDVQYDHNLEKVINVMNNSFWSILVNGNSFWSIG